MTNPEDIKELVSRITDFVNSYSADRKQFINQMSTEHRTLQQSFTRLVLEWLEFVASDDYRYDDRNKASHEIALKVIKAFRYVQVNTNGSLMLPSSFLPII